MPEENGLRSQAVVLSIEDVVFRDAQMNYWGLDNADERNLRESEVEGAI